MKHITLIILCPFFCFSQKQITKFVENISNNNQVAIIGATASGKQVYFQKKNNEKSIEIFKTLNSGISDYILVDSFLPDMEIEQNLEIGNEIYFVLKQDNKIRSLWKLNKYTEKLTLSISNISNIQLFVFKGKILGTEKNVIYELKNEINTHENFKQLTTYSYLLPKVSENILITYSVDNQNFNISVYDSLFKESNYSFKNLDYQKVHNLQKLNDDYVITISKFQAGFEYTNRVIYVDYLWSNKTKELRLLGQDRSRVKKYYYKNNQLQTAELEELNDRRLVFKKCIFNEKALKTTTDSTITDYKNYYYYWGFLGPNGSTFRFSEIEEFGNSFYFIGNNDSVQKPNSMNVSLLQFDSNSNQFNIYPLSIKSKKQRINYTDPLYRLKSEDGLIKIYSEYEASPSVALDLKMNEIVKLDSLSESSFESYKVSNSEVFVLENNQLFYQNKKNKYKKEIKIASKDIIHSRILKVVESSEHAFLIVKEDENKIGFYVFDGTKMIQLLTREVSSSEVYINLSAKVDNKIMISLSTRSTSKYLNELFLYNLETSTLSFLTAIDKYNFNNYDKIECQKIGDNYFMTKNDFHFITNGTINGSIVLNIGNNVCCSQFISPINNNELLFEVQNQYFVYDIKSGKSKEIVELYMARILSIKNNYIYYFKSGLLFRTDMASNVKLLYTINNFVFDYATLDNTKDEFLFGSSGSDLIYFRVSDEKILKIVTGTNFGLNAPFFYKLINGKVEYLFETRNALGDVLNYRVFDINSEKIVLSFEKGFKNGYWYFLRNTNKNILISQSEKQVDFFEIGQNGFTNALNLPGENVEIINAIRNNYYDQNILISVNGDINEMSILNLNDIKVGISKFKLSGTFSAPNFLNKNGNSSFFVFDNYNFTNPVRELWFSDGSLNNTQKLSNYFNFELFKDSLQGNYYYSSYDTFLGNELFQFNYTSGEINIVSDIYSGIGSSSPKQHFKIRDNIYTLAYTPSSGIQLWLIGSNFIRSSVLSKSKELAKVNVFPNPSSIQFVTISLDNYPTKETFQYQLLTNVGQLISEGSLINNEKLNLVDVKYGVYILKIKIKNDVFFKRIIVN